MTNPIILLEAAKVAYPEQELEINRKFNDEGEIFIETISYEKVLLYPRDTVSVKTVTTRHVFDPINNKDDFYALWVGLCKLGFNVYYSLLFQGWKINIENDEDCEINTIDWVRIKEIKEPTPELAALKLVEVIRSLPGGGE